MNHNILRMFLNQACASHCIWFLEITFTLPKYALVLGNISIFWKYRDISFDNISYRRNFLISKYRISILIVFIVFMYATHEVYSLDMSTSVM